MTTLWERHQEREGERQREELMEGEVDERRLNVLCPICGEEIPMGETNERN